MFFKFIFIYSVNKKMQVYLNNELDSHNILFHRFTPKKSDDIENDMIYIDGNIYSNLNTYLIMNSFDTSIKNLMIRDLNRSIRDKFIYYREINPRNVKPDYKELYPLSSDYFYGNSNGEKKIYEEDYIIDHLSDMINENIQIEINKSILDELDNFFIGPEKKITKEGAHNHSLLLLYDESGISDGNIIFSMYDVNTNTSKNVKDRLIFYRNKAIENIRNFLSEDLLYDNYVICRAITYFLYHPISNHDNLMKYINTLDSKKLKDFAYIDVKRFKINLQKKSDVYNKTVSLILILLNKNIRLLSQIVPKYFDNNLFNEMFYSYVDKSEIDKFNIETESEVDINDIIDIEKKLIEINRTNIQDYGYHNLSFNEKEYFMLEDISMINIYRILFVKTICPRLFISEDIGDDYNKFALQIIRNVYPRLNVYKKSEIHRNSLDLLLHSFIKNNRDNILSELKKDKNFDYEQKDLDTEYRKLHSILQQKYSSKIIENNDQYINSFDKSIKVNKDGKEIHYSIYNVYKKCINELAEVDFGSYTSKDINNLQNDEFFGNYIDIELYKKNKDMDILNIQNIYLLQEKLDNFIKKYYNSESYDIDFRNSRKINFYTSKTKNKLFIFGNLINLHRNILISISKKIKVYGTVKLSYKHIRDDLYIEYVKCEFDEKLNHKTYLYDIFYKKDESYNISFSRRVRLAKTPKNIKESRLMEVLHLTKERSELTIKNIDEFVNSKLFVYNDDINRGLNITFFITLKNSIVSTMLLNITSKYLNFIFNDFKSIMLKSPDKYFKNYMKCLKSVGNSYIYIYDNGGYNIYDDILYEFKKGFLLDICLYYNESLNNIKKDVSKIVLYTYRSMELFFCKRFLNSILKINDDNIPKNDHERQIKKIYRIFDKEQFKYCFYQTFKIVDNIKKLYITSYEFTHDIYKKKYYSDHDLNYDYIDDINKSANETVYYVVNMLMFGNPEITLLGKDKISDRESKSLTLLKEYYIDFVKNYVDDEYRSKDEYLKKKIKEVITTDDALIVLKNYVELYKKFYVDKTDLLYAQNNFYIEDVQRYAGENFNPETFNEKLYIEDFIKNYGYHKINPATIINYYLVSNINRLGNDANLYTIYKDMELNRNKDLIEYKKYLSKYEIYDKLNSDMEYISIVIIDLSITLLLDLDGYDIDVIDLEKYKTYLYKFKYDLFFNGVTDIKIEDLNENKLNEIICKVITFSKNLNIKNKYTYDDKYKSYLEIIKNDEEQIKNKNKDIMKKYFQILRTNLEVEKRNKNHEKLEKEKFEKEKERLEKLNKKEKEKLEKLDKKDKEIKEKEIKEKEIKEKERIEKERKERIEKERKERIERIEKERKEKIEKIEKERIEKEKLKQVETLDKVKDEKTIRFNDKGNEIIKQSEILEEEEDDSSGLDFEEISKNIPEINTEQKPKINLENVLYEEVSKEESDNEELSREESYYEKITKKGNLDEEIDEEIYEGTVSFDYEGEDSNELEFNSRDEYELGEDERDEDERDEDEIDEYEY